MTIRTFVAIVLMTAAAFGVRAILLANFGPPEMEPAKPIPYKDFDRSKYMTGAPLDGKYLFTDQGGKPFDLATWYDKPLVVSYMFTKCGDVCPAITASLMKVVEEVGSGFGKDFRIVSIGFDTANDTVPEMKKFGERFTKDFTNWKFLSGDDETTKKLSEKLGIAYMPGPDKVSWAHSIGVTVVYDGKVYRQVKGSNFPADDVLSKVKSALAGTP